MKKLLTPESIILIVIALAMLNNVEHLAYVHHSIARGSFHNPLFDRLHSIVVVLILELIIITLVHYGQKVFAGFYTLMLFCLQLIYYPLEQYWQTEQYGKFYAAVIYSAMFTISIYYFSIMRAKRQELAARRDEFRTKFFEASKKLEEAERNCTNFERKLQETNTIMGEYYEETKSYAAKLDETKRELQQKEKELQELKLFKQQTISACTCPKCGQSFESEASKRSHMGKCKGNIKQVAA